MSRAEIIGSCIHSEEESANSSQRSARYKERQITFRTRQLFKSWDNMRPRQSGGGLKDNVQVGDSRLGCEKSKEGFIEVWLTLKAPQSRPCVAGQRRRQSRGRRRRTSRGHGRPRILLRGICEVETSKAWIGQVSKVGKGTACEEIGQCDRAFEPSLATKRDQACTAACRVDGGRCIMHGLDIGGDGDRAIEMEFGLELEETADTRGGCERPRRKETEDERDSFGGQGSLNMAGGSRSFVDPWFGLIAVYHHSSGLGARHDEPAGRHIRPLLAARFVVGEQGSALVGGVR